MAETLRPEVVRPEVWTMDTVKTKLLEGARGNVPPVRDFPLNVRLNPRWIRYFEELQYEKIPTHDAGAVLVRKAGTEMARILKTNADRTKVLIQTALQGGGKKHVRLSLEGVVQPELYLGNLHYHPVESPFNSEDIGPMFLKDGDLVDGIITPGKYYLALRSSETPVLGTTMEEVRNRLAKIGESHGLIPVRHKVTGSLVVPMLPEMLKELNIPLYEGERNQPDLQLAW